MMMERPRTPPNAPVASTSRTGRLDEARSIVLEDLGDIPLVSVDFFLESALPPVDNAIVCNIKKTLQQKKHIKGEKWTRFPKAPQQTGSPETEAFQALPSLFECIIKAALPVMKSAQTLEFVYKPTETPLSERTHATRPDAQLQLKEKKSLGTIASGRSTRSRNTAIQSHWEDIVVAFELELKPSHWEDNASKLIWNAHHIMRTDPCRRFTFGITIEDTQTRLWFFTRAHVMVTHPFNFTEDLDTVIRLFTSLAFANDTSLGFDPTVSRIRVSDQIQYKFHVGEEYYITEETLSDHAANFIRGRGTRVFKAHSESNPGHIVVLKDVWLEQDKTEEGNLLESMRTGMEEMKTNGTFPSNTDPSKYFLSVRAHGRVMVGKLEDHTTNVIMRGSIPPSNCQYLSTSTTKTSAVRGSHVIGSDRDYSKGHTPQLPSCIAVLVYAKMPHKELRIYPRIHYRIVFNELGKTVYSLDTLSDVFRCLVDATTALEVMHTLGYVHRDISAGNLLFLEGGGIISDLESVKKTTDLTVHEVRTGTNQFEPIEVGDQQYLFRKDDKFTPFKFNCIHDLESTWWIALWVLFHHTPVDDEEDRSVQIQQAIKLFPPVGSSNARQNAFRLGFQRCIQNHHPTFQYITKYLDEARLLLVDRYTMAEQGTSINETAFVGLHQELRAIWQTALDDSEARCIKYKYVLPPEERPAQEPLHQQIPLKKRTAQQSPSPSSRKKACKG